MTSKKVRMNEKQLELNLGDEESAYEGDGCTLKPKYKRKTFTFDGMSTHNVSFDPREFRGMPIVAITAEIKEVLASIAPGVSFFENELEAAASELATDL